MPLIASPSFSERRRLRILARMLRRLAPASLLILSACTTALQPPPGPAVSLPPPPPRGEPVSITGMNAARLRQMYGAPAFVRRDNDAEIWRYDGQACRAFFFLYQQGGNQVVRHVETLPRGANIAADETCLTGLRERAPAS